MTIEIIADESSVLAPPAEATLLRLQVLGPLRVWQGETEVSAGPRQQAYLLGVLLAREGRPTAAEELIDLLWGDDAPASALNVVHKYIGAIRRLLEPTLPPRGAGRFLVKQASGYVCTIGPDVLDLTAFRRDTGRARAQLREGDPEGALDSLLAALALWSGPAGDGWVHGPGAAPIFAALNDEYFAACIEAASVAESLRRPARVLPALQRAAAMAPLHEPVQASLVTLLGRTGQQAEALAVFDMVRRRLDDELGIDPGAALLAARQSVLVGAVDLEPAVTPVPTSPPVPTSTPYTPQTGAFVGRARERAALNRAVEPVLTGGRAAVIVEGEAGAGKSRLLESLAADVEAHGSLVAWGRCLEGDGTPTMWPWVEVASSLLDALPEPRRAWWLNRDLGRFVGASREVASPPDGNARFRLLDDLVHVIDEASADRPLVVILDDLQWAEAGSLQLLDSIIARLPSGVAIVGAMRDEGVTRSLELTRTLATISRTLDHRRVVMRPLEPDEVAELVHSETGVAPRVDVAELIMRRTAGNPFFVRELARLLGADGLRTADAVESSGVPVTVRDVVRDRLAALDGPTTALLEIAALIGRSVELVLLARAAAIDIGSCLESLEPVRALGLMGPAPDDPFSYRYTHDLVRQAVSDGMSPARASVINGRIADAIESGALTDESAPERLAHHLWAAGPVTEPARTVSALIGAGSRAAAKTSLQAAERHLGSAVDLARKSALPDLELAAISQLIAVVGMRSMYGIASVSLLERAEQVARHLGEDRIAAGFLFSRWTAHGQGLQLDRSTELAEALERTAATSSDPIVRAYGMSAAGIHRWCVGDIGGSYRRLATISSQLVPSAPDGAGNPVHDGVQLMAAGMFAEITGYHGDVGRAQELFDGLSAAAGHDPYAVTVATSFEARTAAVSGDPLGALRS